VRRTSGTIGTNKQNSHLSAQQLHSIEKKVDDGDLSLNRVSSHMRNQIIKTRSNKNMTQKDLAKACHLPLSVIQQYEKGTCICKVDQVAKIGKILGVQLKK
jgi:ribosome-binding protein aMBF1 (putative translation factor)